MTLRNWIFGLAVLAALAPTHALAIPAHYVVFTMDEKGHVRPDFYQQVELARAPEPLSADLGFGEGTHTDERIVYRAFRQQVDLGERSASLPLLRGEFAHDPEGGDTRIDAHVIRAAERSFVLRIPLDDADTVEFSGAKVAAQRFDLGELAALAHTLPLKSFSPAVQIAREPQNGGPANRVDILVMSEGYTSAQQAIFNADAQSLSLSFFGLTPYREYKSFVNWTTGFVESTQSGADHPPYQMGCTTAACCSDGAARTDLLAGQFVNTAFDGKFCDFQIHRLLTINTAKVNASAAAYPDWDKIIVLVNDAVYGGSGGAVSVSSTNISAKEILLHEYGHTFTGLADEYSSPFPGYPACSDLSAGRPCEANVTNQTIAAQVKWSSWFTPGNPIPTPSGTSGVGLFQGARYLTSDMYRPVYNCLMQDLRFAFCPVCAQEYVLSLYRGGFGVPAGGIDLIEPGSESPATAAPVAYEVGTTKIFQASLLQPTLGQLGVQWYLDGTPIAGANSSSYGFHVPSGAASTRTLELRVTDLSTLVKPAMAGNLLTHSRTWTIQVNNATIDPSGAWYDPAQDGHGLQVQRLADNRILAFWYTFDPAGNLAYFIGDGPFDGTSATLTNLRPMGTFFPPAFNSSQVSLQPFGSMRLEFSSCGAGRATFDLPSGFGQGSMNLTRLTQPAGVNCGSTLTTTATGPMAGASGAWYNPAMNGQGLIMESLPGGLLLATWYTYGPAPLGGQAWLTGLGSIQGNTATLSMLKLSGGRFIPNFNPALITRPELGTATITLSSCSSGSVSYSFGQGFGSGTFPLERLTALAGSACSE